MKVLLKILLVGRSGSEEVVSIAFCDGPATIAEFVSSIEPVTLGPAPWNRQVSTRSLRLANNERPVKLECLAVMMSPWTAYTCCVLLSMLSILMSDISINEMTGCGFS